MRILLALGESAQHPDGDAAEAEARQRHADATAAAIAGVAAEDEVILTGETDPCDHTLELALRNALPGRDVITVLTKVVVDAHDPAFIVPSKPIGPLRPELPAPEPRAIAELRSLRALLGAGALVICAGGGGAPLTFDGTGAMRSIDARIDEDLTAALLARRLDADLLVLVTDAAGPPASKARAASRFVEATGRRAAIGPLSEIEGIVAGRTGAQVTGDGKPSGGLGRYARHG